MTVAVVDVGSNTIRLLVAAPGTRGVAAVREEKAYVGLGAEIVKHGLVRDPKLAEVASVVRKFARIARELGASQIDVLVTAPARQTANTEELLHVLAQASRAPVRALSAEEEGLLAYRGALARAGDLPASVAVCDVGGGSTELVVGAPPAAPSWVRSVDVGALRLTAVHLPGDPPTEAELAAAEDEVERAFEGVLPPPARAALAVGGSARALAAIVGDSFGARELERALELASRRRAAKLAREHGLDPERARLLPAGALILREIARRVGVPLTLARGGVREGAVAELLAEEQAA